MKREIFQNFQIIDSLRNATDTVLDPGIICGSLNPNRIAKIKFQITILLHDYVYNASIAWNWARQVIKSNTDISDFYFSSADAKAIFPAVLKNHILMS